MTTSQAPVVCLLKVDPPMWNESTPFEDWKQYILSNVRDCAYTKIKEHLDKLIEST